MTDADCLLAAIRAHPEDDAPRLAYADWCDENGRPGRAEFIRVQIEMQRLWPHDPEEVGRMPGALAEPLRADGIDPPSPEWHVLAKREEQLLDIAAVQDWSAFPAYMLEWWWVRGFVEKVRLSAVDWLARSDELVAAHPLRDVRLTTLPPFQQLVTTANLLSGQVHILATRPDGTPIQAGTGATIREAVAAALGKEWKGINFELPPDSARWIGEFEQSLLEPTPEFRDVEQWITIERDATTAYVHVVRHQPPLQHGGPWAEGTTYSECRIELRTFAAQRDGRRYHLQAGRCHHNLAAFKRAVPITG